MANIDILLQPAYQAAAEVTSPAYWAQQAYAIGAGAAAQAGFDPNTFGQIFVRQMQEESGLNPYTGTNASGATGIAQIVGAVHPDVDPTDPIASLHYAAGMMVGALQQYGGDYGRALASYNWGSGNTAHVAGLDDATFYRALPGETQKYLSDILGGVRITPPDTGTEGDQNMAQPTPTPTADNPFGFGQTPGKTSAPQQPRAQSNLPEGVFFDPSLPGYVYIDPATGQKVPWTPDPTGMLDPQSPYNQHQSAMAAAETQNANTTSGRLALDARDAAIKNSLDLINSLHQLNQIDLTRQEDVKKNILSALPYTSQGNQPYNPNAVPFDPSMSPGYDALIAYHLAQLEPQVAAQPGAATYAPPVMSAGYSRGAPPPPAASQAPAFGMGSPDYGAPSGMFTQSGNAP
ncbi:MAG: lytic transglycosylase domain-containing protein [Chloroflexota bacterium]|nr:lytic transglycosylase domain-containing protein [Chloroflexota bacterium]